MLGFEKYATEKSAYIAGLVEAGVPEYLAEFCAKQAEYENMGRLDPVEYTAGFMEEFEKAAAVDLPFMPSKKDDDDESIWSKLKRWGLYTGIGAGGFLLGNYWPDIKNYTTRSLENVSSAFHTKKDVDTDLRKPDNPPAAGNNAQGGGK